MRSVRSAAKRTAGSRSSMIAEGHMRARPGDVDRPRNEIHNAGDGEMDDAECMDSTCGKEREGRIEGLDDDAIESCLEDDDALQKPKCEINSEDDGGEDSEEEEDYEQGKLDASRVSTNAVVSEAKRPHCHPNSGPGNSAVATSRNTDWPEMPLDLRLLKAITKLGLKQPTSIQSQCIPLVLQGRDVLARAPTGSGKTYAYAIPMLQQILRRHDSGTSSSAPGVGAIVLVPTRELCQQVHSVMCKLLGHAGTAGIQVIALATPSDSLAFNLDAPPDVLLATPARMKQLLALSAERQPNSHLCKSVHLLVVDEADLLLSYGYGDDIMAIGEALPPAVQTLLLSATITPDLDSVRSLFLHNPETIDVEEDGHRNGSGLKQFWLRCSHADKFLVMYALFKLNRIPGRSLIFVNSVDRGFRLRLFLEQFGVKAGVLNCELPLASRWHAIQAFNRGLFDILIATDDPKLMTGQVTSAPGAETSTAPGDVEMGFADGEDRNGVGKKRKRSKLPTSGSADVEFGVARGVDFTDVTAVLNMDLPTSLAVYRHRVGRTARAGMGGTAISLVSPEAPDESLLLQIQEAYPQGLHQFQVDMNKLAAFRYRTDDALRAVTRQAVKDARLEEIKRELMHSKKLASHFESNPEDLEMLKHDRPLATARKQTHLSHVPTYLKPETDGATEAVPAVGSSSQRLARKGKGGKHQKLYGKRGKRSDPLRSFKGGKGKARNLHSR